ncbi:hypothetical protein GCM10009802_61630 [Streptomyces synnematoformans]|uniref:Uncharacterized protein n=1 Tax=Streptomyces synnematoformans TaxID=415721 RepID=A0ABN1ZW71_9ACTN
MRVRAIWFLLGNGRRFRCRWSTGGSGRLSGGVRRREIIVARGSRDYRGTVPGSPAGMADAG